jgi:hypothetical protein
MNSTFDRIFRFIDEHPEEVSAVWNEVMQHPFGDATNQDLINALHVAQSGFPWLNSFFVDTVHVFETEGLDQMSFDFDTSICPSVVCRPPDDSGWPYSGIEKSVAGDTRHTHFWGNIAL